jgi:hypothetical protein
VTPAIFTFRRGVLRLGNEVIPLEWTESHGPNMRVALSLLMWFFRDELNTERRAFAFHYQLGRRLVVGEGWSMTQADLAGNVADILCKARLAEEIGITLDYMGGERRDRLRQLAQSETISVGRHFAKV